MHKAQREKVHRALAAGAITITDSAGVSHTFPKSEIMYMSYEQVSKRSSLFLVHNPLRIDLSYPTYRMVKHFMDGRDPSLPTDPWIEERHA